jgi:hypothetical protein
MRPVPHEFGRRPCACSQERARVERWVAELALLAYTVIAQAKGASVPEYMDVHRNMKGITPEDLLKAHQADLDVQDQENADFKKAWGDPETGIVFCLSEAPSKEAVMRTHERAGHPTDEVYEITATA